MPVYVVCPASAAARSARSATGYEQVMQVKQHGLLMNIARASDVMIYCTGLRRHDRVRRQTRRLQAMNGGTKLTECKVTRAYIMWSVRCDVIRFQLRVFQRESVRECVRDWGE